MGPAHLIRTRGSEAAPVPGKEQPCPLNPQNGTPLNRGFPPSQSAGNGVLTHFKNSLDVWAPSEQLYSPTVEILATPAGEPKFPADSCPNQATTLSALSLTLPARGINQVPATGKHKPLCQSVNWSKSSQRCFCNPDLSG